MYGCESLTKESSQGGKSINSKSGIEGDLYRCLGSPEGQLGAIFLKSRMNSPEAKITKLGHIFLGKDLQGKTNNAGES